ncbi:MAG: Bacterial regulatory protein lacI family [Paenibacillus sp.]|nr:Bacterial regulatory protein lacI family [Paenibacillus sp.]
MYTIKDVAREADVSIATVSRVINGKDMFRTRRPGR